MHASFIIIQAAVAGACVLAVAVITIVFCFKSIQFFGSIKEMIQNKLSILSLLTMILCWSALMTLILHLHDYPLIHFKLGYGYAMSVFSCAFTFFYLTLILRVYTTFKQYPEYSVSKNITCCFGMFIFITACIFDASWYFGNHWQYNWSDAIAISMDIMVVPFNICLLYLFLKRFYRMILDLDESFLTITLDENINYNNNNNNNDNDNDNINHRQLLHRNQTEQMEIVDLMSKITLLTVMEQLLFAGWVIPLGIEDFLIVEYGYTSDSHLCVMLTWIKETFMLIDACFICFVLHFTFVFNHNQYQRCCHGCHKRFKKCCISCVVKNTLRNRAEIE